MFMIPPKLSRAFSRITPRSAPPAPNTGTRAERIARLAGAYAKPEPIVHHLPDWFEYVFIWAKHFRREMVTVACILIAGFFIADYLRIRAENVYAVDLADEFCSRPPLVFGTSWCEYGFCEDFLTHAMLTEAQIRYDDWSEICRIRDWEFDLPVRSQPLEYDYLVATEEVTSNVERYQTVAVENVQHRD